MQVLVLERNLLWSSKLANSLKHLGHEAVLLKGIPRETGEARLAIINLSEPDTKAVVSALHELGLKVIGHAGHKEKNLLSLGKDAGVDIVATNSELTFKLPELLSSS